MNISQRFDPAKGYKALLFYPDRVAQSEEMREMQAASDYRLRRLADVLFSDGEITEGARCSVNPQTGACALEAGGIYIAGEVHTVAAANFVVPVVGVVVVGVRYLQRIVTAEEDPSLYSQAINMASYGEPGADRLQVTVAWGLAGEEAPGDFYPVWTIEDGIVRPREPAPTLNAVVQAIARYDRDSAGGTYVVDGLNVIQLPDEDGAQVYAVTAGSARVGGVAVEMPVDRRLVYAAVPNTAQVLGEPHSSATDALQHVEFDRWPVLQPATVRIQRRKTQDIVHGGFAGAADPLPDNSVVQINTVQQGGTTYTKDVDYRLTAGQIDWSLSGAEPAPGSTYQATYEFISVEAAQNQTPRGFDVQGALKDTIITVDYAYALRRIDRIVMDAAGRLDVIKGVPATWKPVAPEVPPTVLALASVAQTWDGATRGTTVDSVRTVPMPVLVAYARRMDDIEMDLAELRLATDVNGRYGGLKKGYFADPMLDNSMRDQGIEQTALIEGNALQLYEAQSAHLLGDGRATHTLDFTLAASISQAGYSRSMTVGDAPAGRLPATVTLMPAVDRWEVPGERNYPRTVAIGAGLRTDENTVRGAMNAALVDTSGIHLREMLVQFEVAGFQPLEALEQVVFDGRPIALGTVTGTHVASATGVLSGAFTVPAGVPTGTKNVQFLGASGSQGEAHYTGAAAITLAVQFVQSSIYGGVAVGYQKVTYVA